jgi:hypothetical protein
VEKTKSSNLFTFALMLGLIMLGLMLATIFYPDFLSFSSVLTLAAGLLAVIATLVFDLVYRDAKHAAQEARIRIEQIEDKAEKQPEKVKFAWEIASAKLEAYFDRNLTQVFAIFVLAIIVMLVGFAFVLWGVTLAIRNPTQNTSWIAAISGIITEFIGLTFMVLYRSTMAQANTFMQVLERINTVGMAVQILDSIPESETQLKNSTRAQLVGLLFENAAQTSKQTEPESSTLS